MNAISAVRRQVREMVDGTLEVKLHISPIDKASFHRLFPEIDMPVAIAPLSIGAPKQEARAKQKLGQLGLLAVQWCESADFAAWFFTETGERFSVQAFKDYVGINKRTELDTDDQAAHRFQSMIRGPYMDYLENKI